MSVPRPPTPMAAMWGLSLGAWGGAGAGGREEHAGPGGPGRSPAQGSHRPVRAQLTHTVPRVTVSLRSVHRLDDHRCRERVTLQELAEAGRRNRTPSAAAGRHLAT